VPNYEAEINNEFISMKAIKRYNFDLSYIEDVIIFRGLPRGTTEVLSCAEATDRRDKRYVTGHRVSVNSAELSGPNRGSVK
jgi:hypothetical protein